MSKTQTSTGVLALDIGERKIGVARANVIAKLAEPLTTLTNDATFLPALKELMKDHDARDLVVGLPRGLSGQDTGQTQYVKDFCKQLDSFATVHFQDEALTSVEAEKILKSKKSEYTKEDIDAMAAVLILKDYLEEA